MMKTVLQRWLVGVVVAFLLVCPHLRMYSNEWTRYWAFWGRGDALAFGTVILLVGTLLLLAHSMVRRLEVRRLNRAVDATFVVVVGLSVIAYVRTGGFAAEALPVLPAWVWLGVSGAVLLLGLASMVPRFKPIPRVVRAGCLIVSPVVWIMLVQLFGYTEYSVTHEQFLASEPAGGATGSPRERASASVYLLIFDGWSYDRTFTALDTEREMPNLAALVRSAVVYHDAHSPYPETRRSIPGILFQTCDAYVCRDGKIGFDNRAGEFVDVRDRSNLFTRMKRMGLRTCMVGWGHPYRRMFGAELDFSFSAPFPEGNGDDHDFFAGLSRHLWFGFGKTAVAIPKPAGLQWRVKRFWKPADFNENAVKRLKAIHGTALAAIAMPIGSRFGVFHYSVPHSPLIFTRKGVNLGVCRDLPLDYALTPDGTFARPDPDNHIARYTGNLRYMDTLLGELLAAMKSAGHFDESMIILTSDHSWRVDPRFDDLCIANGLILGDVRLLEPTPPGITHVPLVVKYPHQTETRDIRVPFLLNNLQGLIDAAFQVEHAENATATVQPSATARQPALPRRAPGSPPRIPGAA